jgi:hypothetical protein
MPMLIGILSWWLDRGLGNDFGLWHCESIFLNLYPWLDVEAIKTQVLMQTSPWHLKR